MSDPLDFLNSPEPNQIHGALGRYGALHALSAQHKAAPPQFGTKLVVIVAVAALSIGCAIGAAVVLAIVRSPIAGGLGLDWSHRELIKHLKAEGLKFDAMETESGAFWGPAMNFSFDNDIVYVQLSKTAQEAKDEASPKGNNAYAWGRFLFVGSSARLGEIQKALQ